MSRGLLGAIVILAGLVLVVGLSSVFTVQQGEQAMVVQLGQPRRVVEEPGLHFKWPLVESVAYFDKRVLDFDSRSMEVPTLDQKQMVVDAFARFRIVNPLLFYQTVGNEEGVQGRLANIISSNLRRVLGSVPMARVLTEERVTLMANIRDAVNIEAKTFGVDVIDVRIRHVDLPEENSQAIFRRMQSQREQEARKIRAEGAKEAQVLRAEADKQQRVIVAEASQKGEALRGEGDGTATQVYNDAYGRDPQFFDFYRSMQAMTRALTSDTTSYVGPADGSFFRYFGTGEPPKPAP
jgi:modulator of FtsH protease HflC